MPKFELDRLDYEPPGKSASVVNTPKGSRKAKGPPTATGNEIRTGNGTEKESGKVGNTEGKRP
ncbi:hypothetical protein, partial [Streptomyces sp. NPDC059881]